MTRFTERKSKKFLIAAVVVACAVFLTVSVTWIITRQRLPRREAAADIGAQKGAHAMPVVSLEDIAQLPAEATYENVARLLKGYTFADNLMYRCPAKEGGIYVFLFSPTSEIPLSAKYATSDKLMLAAVITLPSEEALLKGDYSSGTYVYPARLAGAKFSGFSEKASPQKVPERSSGKESPK
jgi:hypothetical protein